MPDTQPSSPLPPAQKTPCSKLWIAVYVVSVLVFLVLVGRFYHPDYGFTSLIEFGDKFDIKNLPPHCYIQPDSYGYDGQHYAKLALDPLILHPTHSASQVDSLSYRSRRIFMSWTAYLIGMGKPEWIIQVYAVQNIACWFILACVLLHWFPPTGLNNYLRWVGVLFSGGMLNSIKSALADGPSLLIVAIALVLYERRRYYWSSAMLAVTGLSRETNLLALSALADPTKRTLKDIGRLVLYGVIAVTPLFLWMIYLKFRLGTHSMSSAGTGNFTFPLHGLAWKWGQVVSDVMDKGWSVPERETLLVHLGLTVQALFFVCRPRFTSAIWRVGASYVVLMIFLGIAVWEGYPGAAMRVLLPMTLAFNILVPAGRKWLAVLLAGNLTVAYIYIFALSAPQSVTSLTGPAGLLVSPAGDMAQVTFDKTWHPMEVRFPKGAWRWTPGTASVNVHNPQSYPVDASLTLIMSAARTNNPCKISVEVNGEEVWSGNIPREKTKVVIPHVRLEPGDHAIVFKTPKVLAPEGGRDTRPLAFSLSGLYINLNSQAK